MSILNKRSVCKNQHSLLMKTRKRNVKLQLFVIVFVKVNVIPVVFVFFIHRLLSILAISSMKKERMFVIQQWCILISMFIIYMYIKYLEKMHLTTIRYVC